MIEQDILLRKKIEKREKIDTIIAYILMVILLGCIGLVLYLKFVREEDAKVDEYIPNYISLSDISSSLNNSIFSNRYMNDGATFGSSVSGDILTVSYVKDDVNINLDIPVVSGELVIELPLDNSDIVTDIYKEIANIICMYYGNQESSCRSTLDNMGEDGIDGIRFVNTENNSTVYITTTRSYAINNDIINNSDNEVDTDENNDVLEW